MKKRYPFALSLMLFGCSIPKKMQEYLDSEDFDVIIDVRTKDEFSKAHVPGAIHIPLADIETYDGDKDEKIAVYCRTGNRSSIAKRTLEELGYKYVINIGGVTDGSVELVK